MKRSELFEVVDVPPYGLTRLRARLDGRRTAWLRWAMPLVAGLAAVLLTVLFWPAAGPELEATPAVYALGLRRADATVLASSQPLVALSPAGAQVEIYALVAQAQ